MGRGGKDRTPLRSKPSPQVPRAFEVSEVLEASTVASGESFARLGHLETLNALGVSRPLKGLQGGGFLDCQVWARLASAVIAPLPSPTPACPNHKHSKGQFLGEHGFNRAAPAIGSTWCF